MPNPLSKIFSKILTKEGEKIVEKETAKVAEEVIEKSAEKTAEKVAEKAAKEAAEKVTKETVQKAAEKAAKEAAEKAASKVVNSAAKGSGTGWSNFGNVIWKGGEKSLGVAKNIAMHPWQAIKTGAVLTSGWNLVFHNKPIFDSVRDYGGWLVGAFAGNDRKATYLNTLNDVENRITHVGDKIRSTTNDIADATHESIQTLKGVGNNVVDSAVDTASTVSNGNSINMFGGFLNNVSKGNVSGLGVAGLLLSAYMMFGRTGILGKIGGLLLGLLMVGANSAPTLNQAPAVQESQSQDVGRGMHI